jgi:hypothetical protein
MFTHGSMQHNEGWNAYYQQEAIQGIPLYRTPPGLVCNNYPPLSFHFIGALSRWTGGVNQTGRCVSLVSLGPIALLCGAIVRRSTSCTPLAAYAALLVVIWLAVFKPDRIGMNDPQLLGSAFGLFGLYAYLRERERPRWLLLSGLAFTVSVFTKHNLLAFPAAVGLHRALRKNWRGMFIWGGVVAAGTTALFAWPRWVDGPYFFAQLLSPRPRTSGYAEITDYLTTFQAPVLLAVVWSLRLGLRSLRHVLALALIGAHALAMAFAGGYGVDRNIFFDCLFCLVIVGALALAECALAFRGLRYRGAFLAALLVAPAMGAVIELPRALRSSFYDLKALGSRGADFELSVKLLKSRPGPALCEDLLLCFEAGKPLVYDPYAAEVAMLMGRVREDALVDLVTHTRFSAVQLRESAVEENSTEPHEYHWFPAIFMVALRKHYRPEAKLRRSLILLPDERRAPEH